MTKQTYDLITHLYSQITWSRKTFGPPGERTNGVIAHIKSELIEIEEDPTCLEEWMDVILLAFDGAWRQGYTPEEIASALLSKLKKNMLRKWPDWRSVAPGLPIEHIKDDEDIYD